MNVNLSTKVQKNSTPTKDSSKKNETRYAQEASGCESVNIIKKTAFGCIISADDLWCRTKEALYKIYSDDPCDIKI